MVPASRILSQRGGLLVFLYNSPLFQTCRCGKPALARDLDGRVCFVLLYAFTTATHLNFGSYVAVFSFNAMQSRVPVMSRPLTVRLPRHAAKRSTAVTLHEWRVSLRVHSSGVCANSFVHSSCRRECILCTLWSALGDPNDAINDVARLL